MKFKAVILNFNPLDNPGVHVFICSIPEDLVVNYSNEGSLIEIFEYINNKHKLSLKESECEIQIVQGPLNIQYL